jgi:hypothetical protein
MSLEPEQAADQEGLDLREKSQMPQLDSENQTGVQNSEQKGGSHMTLKEVPLHGEGGQLSFKAFELADCVSDLLKIEYEKREANEAWNIQIKALKKTITRLSDEFETEKMAAVTK